METLIYYSRNGKKPPFKVTVSFDGELTFINCDCELGAENKICRHKINAIRGDKQKRHDSTSDEVIDKLRRRFGPRSSLRLYLEENWRMLREYAGSFPGDEGGISDRRRILGEAFAHGFLNDFTQVHSASFDPDAWESEKVVVANNLNVLLWLKYIDFEGDTTERKVAVKEVFFHGSDYYFLAHCSLRNQERSFRLSRIQDVAILNDGEGQSPNVIAKLIQEHIKRR